MRLTELVEMLDDGRQRCNVCQWRCALAQGEQGHCLMRTRGDAGIEVVNDGMISAATVGPVDAHRLWHFFPNTQVLSIGSWGYAFPSDQQRGQYASPPEDESKRRRLDPERAGMVAMQQLCRGVLWTYSDPSISHEYVLDLL